MQDALLLLGLGLADRGLGAAGRFLGSGQTAGEVADLALVVEQLGLRHDVLGGQRQVDVHLLLGQAKAGLQARGGRLGLGQVTALLFDLGRQGRALFGQSLLAQGLQLLFVDAGVGHGLGHVHRTVEVLAVGFVAQARSPHRHGAVLGLDLAQFGGGLGVVQPHQQLAGLHRLARADQDRLHLRRVCGLDDLGLAGGDHLALAARHLLQLGEGRPHHEQDKTRRDQHDQPARAAHRGHLAPQGRAPTARAGRGPAGTGRRDRVRARNIEMLIHRELRCVRTNRWPQGLRAGGCGGVGRGRSGSSMKT